MSEVEAIRARAAAATPGPWRWRGNTDHEDPHLTAGDLRVLAVEPRERTRSDPGFAQSREYFLEFCPHLWPVRSNDEDHEEYDARVSAAADEFADDNWLADGFGAHGYRCDDRLSFTGPMDGPFLTKVWARDAARWVVCPDATTPDDPRVYRRDVAGMRHPDAAFIEASRADVDTLLGVVDALRAQLTAAGLTPDA